MTAGRVLVVDDAAFNRRLLRRLLTSLGHEVGRGRGRPRGAGPAARADGDAGGRSTSCCSTSSCRSWTASRRWRRCRRIPRCATCRSSSSPTSTSCDSVVRCIRMGAADYLPKTVDPEILRARIEASLAHKRLHDVERAAIGGAGAAAGDDRSPARRAVAVPVATGRGARLERGRRGDAGRPPTRDHRDVLRPAPVHGLLRDRRAGGGPRVPARLPRG